MNIDTITADQANDIMTSAPRVTEANGIYLDDQMIKGKTSYDIKHIDRDGYAIARCNSGQWVQVHTDEFKANRFHR